MSSEMNKSQDEGFMVKVATFIVDKRNLVFLVVGILTVFALISRNWVSVENNLAKFLPSSSNTRAGLDVMEEEFVTFGTAEIVDG